MEKEKRQLLKENHKKLVLQEREHSKHWCWPKDLLDRTVPFYLNAVCHGLVTQLVRDYLLAVSKQPSKQFTLFLCVIPQLCNNITKQRCHYLQQPVRPSSTKSLSQLSTCHLLCILCNEKVNRLWVINRTYEAQV